MRVGAPWRMVANRNLLHNSLNTPSNLHIIIFYTIMDDAAADAAAVASSDDDDDRMLSVIMKDHVILKEWVRDEYP
jgi:hypothetical protein